MRPAVFFGLIMAVLNKQKLALVRRSIRLHGEQGQYASIDNGVRRDLWFTVEPSRQNQNEDRTEFDNDRLEVTFLRDESDTFYPGVNELQQGDEFVRDPTHDARASDGPFTFKGEVIESDQVSYTIVVERYVNLSQSRGVRG